MNRIQSAVAIGRPVAVVGTKLFSRASADGALWIEVKSGRQ